MAANNFTQGICDELYNMISSGEVVYEVREKLKNVTAELEMGQINIAEFDHSAVIADKYGQLIYDYFLIALHRCGLTKINGHPDTEPQRMFRCDCCGRIYHYSESTCFTGNYFNEFDVRFAYGSPFDESYISFTLCEICLFNLLRQFKHQPTDDDGQNMVKQFDKYRKDYYRELENLERE
ncbi:hypothetical protein E4665_15880 [Sporolactobacillus shoreae]|uniref:Uncharacterized protein n=1 Tax=Sporolactobacillus shoreae TaxID=1465501 RepID=A0A4Z0GL24_9BACL|nr:hypothetical protein [Sporolactobacillus shoreae]TGA96343.1 hypothetical protein E4665_15880 [Sporolactobacillus shoreae]